MANVSSVFGTMVLNGDWTTSMIKNLNIIKDEWCGWYYNIEADDFEK